MPVEMTLQLTDWRGLFVVLGGLAALVSAVLYFVVPKRDTVETVPGTLSEQLAVVVLIFSSPIFWRIAPLCVASQSTFLGIQSLWSGPWLTDVSGLGREAVAEVLFLIAVAMVGGFIGVGTIADWLGRFGVRTINVALVGMTAFTGIQLCLVLQLVEIALALWMLFGFFGTTGILLYAVLPTGFPPEFAGRVITSMNVLTFGAAFASQWGIGAIINLWPESAAGGYDPAGYRFAFAVMLSIQFFGLLWYGLFRRDIRI